MRRAPFWIFAEELRMKGYSYKKIREILEKMIEEGYAEGDDYKGYVLTEKGVTEIERRAFESIGVR